MSNLPKWVILEKDGDHGDWKTSSVRPGYWPTIPKGTKVEVIAEFTNFYGRYWTVIGPNGNKYDLEKYILKAVPNDYQ